MKKWIYLILPVAVLVALNGCKQSGAPGGAPGGPGAAPAAPEYGEVTRDTISKDVESTGRVASNLDVEIKCRASGQITSLPFDVSDQVKKGDLLVEIDPVDQARNLQQVEAQRAASEARLAQAKANVTASERNLDANRARAQAAVASAEARAMDADAKYKRDQSLLEKKHVSVEEVETSRTTAAQAHANVSSADADLAAIAAQQAQLEADRQAIQLAQVQITSDDAALALSRQRLSETKVVSPIDGVVSARPVQIGQIIASGINNVGGGTSVMTVSDLSRMFVLASVDESDIGSVQEGQKATITADSFPTVTFEGEVQRIASKGLNTTNVVTFEVKIEVTSDNKAMLKPEMTANVQLHIASAPDVLTAPIRAISRKGQDSYLTVVSGPDNKEQQVPVKTGISDGFRIEITEGATEGAKVLLVRSDSESRWRNQEPRRMPSLFGGGGGRSR